MNLENPTLPNRRALGKTMLAGVLLFGSLWAFAAPAATREFPSLQVRGALEAILPAGVSLDQVKVVGSTVSVSGKASDTVQLSQFLRAIESAPEFEAPDLEQIANVNGESAFSLAARIACPDEAVSGSQLCAVAGSKPKPAKQTIYKCRINGTVGFQGSPCPPGSEV